MDEVNKIRKLYFDKGKNKDQIAKEFNRSWKTIDRLVETPREKLSRRGKCRNRQSTVITPEVKRAIADLLETEERLKVKKKQRYTAEWIYRKLSDDNIYKGKIRALRYTVSKIRESRAQSKKSSYLPLEFELGSTIQIDHGEAEIFLNGQRVKGYLFVSSVPGAALRYCQFFLIVWKNIMILQAGFAIKEPVMKKVP